MYSVHYQCTVYLGGMLPSFDNNLLSIYYAHQCTDAGDRTLYNKDMSSVIMIFPIHGAE